MSSPRAGLRFLNAFRRSAFSAPQKRAYSAADSNAAPLPTQSKMGQLWNSPVGPKTVHFWAPIMKWGLVIAGAADFARPAEALSLPQNAALTATGLIWTRWCFIIKPRNLFLASVNFLLFCVGAVQTTRVLLYQRSVGQSVTSEIEEAAKKEGKTLEGIITDPKGALDNAKKA